MIYFIVGILTVLFSKEYIILNSEIIIYITFLSITVFAVKMFSFLNDTFETIKLNEQESLKTSSISLKNELVNNEQNAILNSNAPYFSSII